MKKNFGKLCVGGVFLFGLSMSLTSCEDILGEWSRPTPNPVTPGGGGSSTIAVTGVKLNKAYLRFDKNVLTAQTLTATVSPADATDKTVTWESSNESVATVDENGQVTPKTKGTVTITATAHDGSGMKATSTVIVYDKIVDISALTENVTANEEWLIKGNATTSVAKSINIGDGASATLLDVFITQPITCASTATIILADGSTNTVNASGINDNAAIKVGGAGKTLTIDAETEGTGTLTAKGGSNGAGIGTSQNKTGGNIIINGGRVTAKGGSNGAGIGTGGATEDNNKCGAITINGGTVNATGGDNGAGIGTGGTYANVIYTTAECGNIIINGGTVIATGGSSAAGIGTGVSGANGGEIASQTCGAITIDTGVTSVTATKGSGAPNSIGVGNKANNGGTENQACGTISIADSSKVTEN